MPRPPMGGGSFRGRGRFGSDRGGRGGRGGRGFADRGGRGFADRGGRGFGDRGGFNDGPPDRVVEVSTFLHACEADAVTKLSNEKIPYFNAPIYLENKTQIGKVDEIFGPINESLFSIKMKEGIVATSYAEGDKFFVDPMKLLPLSRFLPQPKGSTPTTRGRGGPRGRGRGFAPRGGGFPGRGPRGRGVTRGGPRGGGSFRGRGRF